MIKNINCFEATIFDLDGLLVDTESVAALANKVVMEKLGYNRPVEDFYCLAGKDRTKVSKILSCWFDIKIDPDSYYILWLKIYNKMISNDLNIKPTALETLNKIKSLGIPIGVATTSERDVAIQKLNDVGILKFFDVIVGYSCVNRRKPAPDPYLLAASLLGVTARNCLAFEDSDSGVASACSAGMTVVQIPDLAAAERHQSNYRAKTLIDGLNQALSKKLTRYDCINTPNQMESADLRNLL